MSSASARAYVENVVDSSSDDCVGASKLQEENAMPVTTTDNNV